MDYGKLAYLQAEDLKKQIESLNTRIETAPYNCIAAIYKRPFYFENGYMSDDYTITAKKTTILTLQYKMLLSSISSESFKFSVYINNVKAETFTDYIGKETKSFIFTVVAEGFPKGENTVKAGIEFLNQGQYTVQCLEINAMGNNIFESPKTLYVDVLEKPAGFFIATSKEAENYINFIHQNLQSDYISTPYFNFNKNGKNYAVSNIYYNSKSTQLDFFAYTDNNRNLVINLYNMITGEVLDTKIIDNDAVKVSACASVYPVGAALAYIKNNEIYTSNITTDAAKIYNTAPKKFETVYGRVKNVIVFRGKNDLVNLAFTTDANNTYLKKGDIEKTNKPDFAETFKEKTVPLGRCENIRFKPMADGSISIYIKSNGAVYERVLDGDTLSERVLAAFCDELIPLGNYFLTRKNDRLNLLK